MKFALRASEIRLRRVKVSLRDELFEGLPTPPARTAPIPQTPFTPPVILRMRGRGENEIRFVPERMKSASPMKSLRDEIRLTTG